MLKAHSWLGISLGAVLYLICFTGTLLVFSHEIERWEQPAVEEFNTLSSAAMSKALQQYTAITETLPESVFLVLPSADEPRAHISAAGEEWFVSRTGELKEPPREGWVHMLRELHYYLHLPHTIGMIVVGVFGVMLMSLIISGILSHPAILKDAFALRLFRQRRLAQTDLHNRLSVWSLPFALMIAMTGAFIGLVGVLLAIAAPIYTDGDRNKLIETVYGADPIVNQPATKIDLKAALDDLKVRAPQADPIYLAFQHLDTERQFLEIGASFPTRLSYSEIYRYDSGGSYINHQGLTDGPIGRVAAYSVYRLHFGQYGGFIVKIFYALFGLAISIVAVSGINIWLAKRPLKTWVDRTWAGIVWGLPASLSFSATLSILSPALSYYSFWLSYLGVLLAAAYKVSAPKTAQYCQWVLSASLVALAVTHYLLHGAHENIFYDRVNITFLLVGLSFALWQFRRSNYVQGAIQVSER